MAKRKICQAMAVVLALGMCTTGLTGCGNEKRADGKTEIEVVSYKPEAVKAFEKIEKQFNETHDDIHLTISSPNEAMTILKTRFIREDYPDIIAIGGDINYSNFLWYAQFRNEAAHTFGAGRNLFGCLPFHMQGYQKCCDL